MKTDFVTKRPERVAISPAALAVVFFCFSPHPRGQCFENLDSGLMKVPVERGDGDGLESTVDMTRTFRELNQGNAVAPLFLLHGLQDEEGRSALALLARYGFMSGGGPRRGVASGFTLQEKQIPLIGWDASTSGFSCTACHSGEFEYKGKRYRVDGMPGLVDIEGWTLGLSEMLGRNNPGTDGGRLELLHSAGRAARYSFDWREKGKGHASPLAPAFGEEDMRLLEKSLDDLRGKIGKVNLQGDPQLGAITPFSRESLSDDPEMRGYQLSFLGGLMGGEMKVEQDLRFLREETDAFMKGRIGEAGNQNLFHPAIARYMLAGGMAKKFREEFDILASRYSNGKSLITALRTYPAAGFGRDDAWGLIDRFIGKSETTKLNRPISIPPLFGCGEYLVFHCDGNTNSMMDRNIAQAVALGAAVRSNGAANLDLRAVDLANRLAGRLHGPEWPAFFPPIERGRIKRGKEIFEEKQFGRYRMWDYLGNELVAKKASCADCHQTPEKIEDQRYYDVGTSKIRLNHYPDQPGMLKKVAGELERIRKATRRHGVNRDITDLEARAWDAHGEPWWEEKKGYVARALDGIWASSPYLHNGSVPTLRDMLRPAGKRPEVFHTGSKVFHPGDVGFESSETPSSYRYDTSVPENSNSGHLFGTGLSDTDKEALIEYLKTFSQGSRGAASGGR